MKFNLSLFPYQEKAWSSQKKFVVLGSGTGAGKTWLLSPMAALSGLVEDGGIILAAGPTLKHLRTTMWSEYLLKFLRLEYPYTNVYVEELDQTLDFADHDLVEGVDWILNKSDTFIKFPQTDVTLMGVGFNEPGTMQGKHSKKIFADELGYANKLGMETIIQRISLKKEYQLIAGTTPYDWGPLKTMLHDPWVAAEKAGTLDQCDIEYIKVRSIDNPYYSKENYYNARKIMPEWRWEMMYNGEFTKPAGIIYESVEYVEPREIPAHWHITGGLDFGYNHPAGIIWVAHDPATGDRYVIDAVIKSRLNLDNIEEILRRRDVTYYCDTSSAGDIATLKAHGIDARPADKAQGSVDAGIRIVDSMFRTGKLKVFSNLLSLKQELLLYSYKLDANGEPTDVVLKENDDGLDALRYNIYTQREGSANPSGMRVGPKRYTHNAMKNYRRRR